jgi:hypothetical protein
VDEPQSRSRCGDEEKNSQPLPGLETPIIQPVAQLYTSEVSRPLKMKEGEGAKSGKEKAEETNIFHFFFFFFFFCCCCCCCLFFRIVSLSPFPYSPSPSLLLILLFAILFILFILLLILLFSHPPHPSHLSLFLFSMREMKQIKALVVLTTINEHLPLA